MSEQWTPERIAEARMNIDGTMPSRLLQDFASALDTIQKFQRQHHELHDLTREMIEAGGTAYDFAWRLNAVLNQHATSGEDA